MTEKTNRDKEPIYSSRRKRSLHKASIFHKLDRFSDNIENTLRYFRDPNSFEVMIASVTEDLDFTTAQGRLVFRMMAVFAQWILKTLGDSCICHHPKVNIGTLVCLKN